MYTDNFLSKKKLSYLSTEKSLVKTRYTSVKSYLQEGSCCGWPFYEALVILVTTLSVAFPCIEDYSVEALAKNALALKASAPLVLDYSSTIVTCG